MSKPLAERRLPLCSHCYYRPCYQKSQSQFFAENNIDSNGIVCYDNGMDADRLHELEEEEEIREIKDAMGIQGVYDQPEELPMKNETLIKDALNNLLPNSGASDDYCQGIMVGLMSALMANGKTYKSGIEYLAKLADPFIRQDGIPIPWKPDWELAVFNKEWSLAHLK